MAEIKTESTITCPKCGTKNKFTMPVNACQKFLECPDCKNLLKPRAGDCCVFCSFGDVVCPPKQNNDENNCCK